MKYDKTIVTACDSNYIWGAFILVASLCYNNVKSYKNVLGIKLTQDEQDLLSQFEDTKVIAQNYRNGASVCLMKPNAIYSAETEIIAWMDADCMVTGDVTDLISVCGKCIQIRFRSPWETGSVYRSYYGKQDVPGKIPKKVLDIWKEDVADLDEPQISTVGVTNCFVLTRAQLPFISLWKEQMEKVIIDNKLQVYNKSSVGYFMTDESVFNSLCAFSSKAPNIQEYKFDKHEDRLLAHFALSPKPWIHWTARSIRFHGELMKILQWCRDEGYRLPPLPNSLKPENYHKELRRLKTRGLFTTARFKLSSQVKKVQAKFKE